MYQLFSSKNIRKVSIVFVAISLIWIGLSSQIKIDESAKLISAPHAGFLAPSFSLTTLKGREVSLSDYIGQPILINIWASWCGPCIAEMAAMQNMYEKYKDDGFVILAVNSTVQDNLINAAEFVSHNQLTFPILLDTEGTVSDIYNLQAMPSSFFIDKSGVIQEVVIGGPMAEALLQTRILSLIGGED